MKPSPTLVSVSLQLCPVSLRTKSRTHPAGSQIGEGRSLHFTRETELEKTLVMDWPHWKMPFSLASGSTNY